MLKTISDFVDLERQGFSPRKQWDCLQNSPILLNQLDNDPKNIVKLIPGWDKKLKFIELSQSEQYKILVLHLSSILVKPKNYSKGDLCFWLNETIQESKNEYGIFVIEMKNLLCLDSASLGCLVNICDQLEALGLPLLFTQLSPKVERIFNALRLFRFFKLVGDLNTFLDKVYFLEKKELFFEANYCQEHL